MNYRSKSNLKLKALLTNGAIGLLLVLNIVMVILTVDSVKPRCVVDECSKARCEKSFYCKDHDQAPHIKNHQYEVKVYYGKK